MYVNDYFVRHNILFEELLKKNKKKEIFIYYYKSKAYMAYTSKRTLIIKKIEQLLNSVGEFDRKQFNLHCLRTLGASRGMIDSILETYAEAGEILVTNDKVKIKIPE